MNSTGCRHRIVKAFRREGGHCHRKAFRKGGARAQHTVTLTNGSEAPIVSDAFRFAADSTRIFACNPARATAETKSTSSGKRFFFAVSRREAVKHSRFSRLPSYALRKACTCLWWSVSAHTCYACGHTSACVQSKYEASHFLHITPLRASATSLAAR